MGETLTEPRKIYERLWAETSAPLKLGQLKIDPLLRNRAGDLRRGVTLVARPDTSVRGKVEAFLREAAAICPNQHFYRLEELHVTVMAIISGSESWQNEMDQLPACRAVLDEVLKNSAPFQIDFRGVTVSTDAVMIQGFPADGILLKLREELRDAFRKHNLGEKLDRRYKIAAAHLTVMRFAEPEADWKRLFDFLQAHRETDFGQTRFQSLQLIWSNWYASAEMVRVLQKYLLKN